MPKDRYKFFRIEAREILESLTESTLSTGKGADWGERVAAMLRLAHTLKGAAAVVELGDVVARAHAVEDLLGPHAGGSTELPAEVIDGVLSEIDAIRERLSTLGQDTARQGTDLDTDDPPVETVRVEVDEIDTLIERVAELELCTESLETAALDVEDFRRRLASASPCPQRRDMDTLEEVAARAHRRLEGALARTRTLLDGIRRQACDFRLLPASALFLELERAARETARSSGKQIGFAASGGDRKLDAHVFAMIRPALLHLVRNAVVHGIETPNARARLGKPPEGSVIVRVDRRGHRLVLRCEDDGQGLDVDAVRVAVAAGLSSGAPVDGDGLSTEDAHDAIFSAGVTTCGSADELSGRGIGLDVVRHAIQRLEGEVRATSTPGSGMTVEIIVPASVAALDTLVVEDRSCRVSLPFAAVKHVVKLSEENLARVSATESVLFEGRTMPFSRLSRLVDEPDLDDGEPYSAVVVYSDDREAAIGVRRVIGRRNEFIKTVPSLVGDLPLVLGASLDSEGDPRLVLDPRGVIDAMGRRRTDAPELRREQTLPILVVDDSLTTRMLEKTILEANGFEVDIAESAEEALSMARRRRYGLCLCDVEMPGMDGFEFVEAQSRDEAIAGELPTILVTTRSSPEDQRRGMEVGARAYILKQEFDEGHLLRTIRGLMR